MCFVECVKGVCAIIGRCFKRCSVLEKRITVGSRELGRGNSVQMTGTRCVVRTDVRAVTLSAVWEGVMGVNHVLSGGRRGNKWGRALCGRRKRHRPVQAQLSNCTYKAGT